MESDVADLTMTIENVPSENPRTGRITALSVISMLRKRDGAPAGRLVNLGLEGKTALVVGGGGGLGGAVARALAREGARVAVAGRDRGSAGRTVGGDRGRRRRGLRRSTST